MERSPKEILGDPFLKEAFSSSQKREIRERQGNHCGMCGGKPGKDKELVVHHKIAVNKGGLDTQDNAIALCSNDHFIANRMFIQFGITYTQLIDMLRPIVAEQPQHDIFTTEYEGMVNRDV